MTLSLSSWVLGSAHRLTERNIWVKFNENSSKSSGDMEQTWNGTINLMTMKCDIDPWPWSVTMTHDLEVWHWPMTLKCDIDPWPWSATLTHDLEVWHWPMTLKCDIDPWHWSYAMGSAHRLTLRNIWVDTNILWMDWQMKGIPITPPPFAEQNNSWGSVSRSLHFHIYMSRDMRFPTMWHFDKSQMSLCRLLLGLETPNAVWSEYSST